MGVYFIIKAILIYFWRIKMSKLDDFLDMADVSEIRETIKETVNGKEFEFIIRPLTQEEHSEFQKRANTIKGKNITFDLGKYNKLVLDACIVEPDFADEKFLNKVKCNSASEFLNKKFPAGVLTDIAEKIQTLSGFETLEADIENAKN